MKNLTDTFKLNNGVKIPCIGYGTWQTPSGEVAVASVKEAIKLGYRHIDGQPYTQTRKALGRG